MSTRLNPYLMFGGEAAQAMEFYRSVFGGTLETMTFADVGGGPPGVEPDGLMHAQLVTPSGYCLMASDTPPDQRPTPGSSVVLCLNGDDADELRGYFERLAEGGTVQVPLEMQMWGDEFGQCVDRFGIVWMVDIGQAPA